MKISICLFLGLFWVSHSSVAGAESSPFSLPSEAGVQVSVQIISDYARRGSGSGGSSGSSGSDATGEGTSTDEEEVAWEDEDPAADMEDPDVGEQPNAQERRADLLEKAEAALTRIDEVLLDARNAQQQAKIGNDLENAGDDDETEDRGTATDMDPETVPDASDDPDTEDSEGQMPGAKPIEKVDPGDYDDNQDIVARQVCDLAEQESDPVVKEDLEKECRKLTRN